MLISTTVHEQVELFKTCYDLRKRIDGGDVVAVNKLKEHQLHMIQDNNHPFNMYMNFVQMYERGCAWEEMIPTMEKLATMKTPF